MRLSWDPVFPQISYRLFVVEDDVLPLYLPGGKSEWIYEGGLDL